MITDLVSRVFAARDAAHREHWRTKSYAQHVALGEFYEAVIEDIDEIVEVFQGQFGPIGDFSVQTKKVPDIAEYLRDEVDWIQSVRDVIANEDPAVMNMIDELCALYLRTLYKLENLQ
jgi:hypothetical protein